MKMTKIILSLILCILLIPSTFASTINNISVVDDKHIDVSFSPDVTFNPTVNGDIKVLKNVNVSFASKDFQDSNKILLTLGDDLLPNTDYTLISIFGVDGSIDFRTDDILENVEKINSDTVVGQGITRLVISDPRVVELYFNNPVSEEEFEFKMLNETLLASMSSVGGSNMTLNMLEPLEINSEYMLMVISLMNGVGSEIMLDESFLDFSTDASLISTQVAEAIIEAEPEVVEEEVGNLEDVALNSAVTSETGPTTWVLIFLTFLVSIFFFLAKRIGRV